MSLTPIPPERRGHVAPMVGKAAIRPAASGVGRQGRSGHRRGKRNGRCWSWDGRTDRGSRRLRRLACYRAGKRSVGLDVIAHCYS